MLSAKQFLQNLFLLRRPLHIFLGVAEPISISGLWLAAKKFGGQRRDNVRRKVVHGDIQSFAHVIQCFAPVRLSIFGQDPVEKYSCCVGMGSLIDQHGTAEACGNVGGVVLELRQDSELKPSFEKLRHGAIARRKKKCVFALGDPFDLAALISVYDSGVGVELSVLVF